MGVGSEVSWLIPRHTWKGANLEARLGHSFLTKTMVAGPGVGDLLDHTFWGTQT